MTDVLSQQKRYYAERAPEYEDWWYRRGRYELDPGALARWQADAAEVESALEVRAPLGRVLELAAGTGIWTRKLVPLAERVVGVDANPETLAHNTPEADLVGADVFDWSPRGRFDLVFFSFWLSHVPEGRLDEFWDLVRTSLEPGGRVFLVDSGAGDTAHTGTDQDGWQETRSLADGRTFRIVKRRWKPAELEERVRPHGIELELRDTTHGHFLYGAGVLA